MGRIKDWDRLFERTEESGDFEAVLLEFPLEEDEGDEEYVGLYEKGEAYFRSFRAVAEKDGGRYKNETMLSEAFPKGAKRAKMTARESLEETFEAYRREEARLAVEHEARLLFENAYEVLSGSEEEIYSPLEVKEGIFVQDGVLFEEAEPSVEAEWAVEREGLLIESMRWDEASRAEGVRLTEEMRKAILDTPAKKEGSTRKHEIRVEMVSGEAHKEGEDMDELIEEMTARLCAMMMKGSDGIYL